MDGTIWKRSTLWEFGQVTLCNKSQETKSKQNGNLTLDCKKQSRCQLRSTEEDKKDVYGINDGTIAFPVPSVPVGLSLLVGLSGFHSRPVHLNSSRHQTIAGPLHLNVSNSIRKRFHFHIPATPAPVSMQ